jgi:hypothetical protein
VEVRKATPEERKKYGIEEPNKISNNETEDCTMAKMTREAVKKMMEQGMSNSQMADYYAPSYPAMEKSLIMAKISMLLSDKKAGRTRKVELEGTNTDIVIVDEVATSAINSHEEHPDDVESAAAEIKELAEIVDKQVTAAARVAAARIVADKIKVAKAVDEMMEMVPDRNDDFVGTYSGLHFWLKNPKSENVNLEDIAQALSKICRFNGHTKRFYSVAEHSLNVEKLLRKQGCNSQVRLYGLLHDAAEAYCCDIPRPLKALLQGYRQIEDGIMKVIYEAFGVPEPNTFQRQLIGLADDYILAVESKELMTNINKWNLAAIDNNDKLDTWDDICIRYMSGVQNLVESTHTA